MRSLTKLIIEALKKQPNVSKIIKDGLPKFGELLERLKESSQSMKNVGDVLRESTIVQGWVTSLPNVSKSAIAGVSGSPVSVVQKRLATSPSVPSFNEVLRRKKIESTTTTQWEVVGSKKKKSKGDERQRCRLTTVCRIRRQGQHRIRRCNLLEL